jgi:hypothetical protein
MTNLNTTEGPWFYNKAKRYVGSRIQEDGQSYGMTQPMCDVYGDNVEADGLLIAAAPELYEALEVHELRRQVMEAKDFNEAWTIVEPWWGRVLDYVPGMDEYKAPEQIIEAFVYQLPRILRRKALAKARGECNE